MHDTYPSISASVGGGLQRQYKLTADDVCFSIGVQEFGPGVDFMGTQDVVSCTQGVNDHVVKVVHQGLSPFQLTNIGDIPIPEGFEVASRPEVCRVEDSYLNMKGKQLGPLRTEELKLVLRPQAKGTYTLKPRISYLDESGRYKTHEPEPVEITVKELGLSGWLKGR